MGVYRIAVCKLKITPDEFWKMPFFVVRDFIMDMNSTGREKGISRKELLDLEREAKIKYGWK